MDEKAPADLPGAAGRMIAVSAVITTYNRPEFVAEAVQSALAQTHPLHEVIVVDDGSPEPVDHALERFGSRVRLVRLDRNSGANVARNRGIDAATGEFVAFLDDDDIWLPDKTGQQLAAMQPGDEACLCGYEVGDERGCGGGGVFVAPTRRVDEDLLRIGNNVCGTSGLLVRRDVIAELRFDPALQSGQDWDVYVRLAMRRPLAHVPQALFRFRRGDHSGITTRAASLSPQQLDEAAAALHKHAGWLGGFHYRVGLAEALLKYIGVRRNKARFLTYALKRAGVGAVAYHLARKVADRARTGRR